MKAELKRKFIHFLSLLYIPTYNLFNRDLMILLVLSLTSIAVLVEFIRLKRLKSEEILNEIMREYEKRDVGAHIYFGIAVSIITIILSKHSCFAGVIVGGLGDGIAGILKRSILSNMTYILMFLSSLLFMLLIGLNPICSIFSALVGTFVERISYKIRLNDNFTVPVTSAFAYEFAKMILNFAH